MTKIVYTAHGTATHGGRAGKHVHGYVNPPLHRGSTVLYPTMGEALDCCDVKRNSDPAVHEFYRAAPGGVPTQTAFSQNRRYPKLDLDRANGCVHDLAHAFSLDGGLAVLYGNIAEKGCVVKKGGEVHIVDAVPVARVVDTTGAGDQFAAGFLYGFTHGMSLADCGRLGCVGASECISHYGARPEVHLRGLAQTAGLIS